MVSHFINAKSWRTSLMRSSHAPVESTSFENGVIVKFRKLSQFVMLVALARRRLRNDIRSRALWSTTFCHGPPGSRERTRFQFWLTPLSTKASLCVHREKISWLIFRGSFETKSGEACVRRGLIEAIERDVWKKEKKDFHAKLAIQTALKNTNVKCFAWMARIAQTGLTHRRSVCKFVRGYPCSFFGCNWFCSFKSLQLLFYPSNCRNTCTDGSVRLSNGKKKSITKEYYARENVQPSENKASTSNHLVHRQWNSGIICVFLPVCSRETAPGLSSLEKHRM